MGAVDVTEMFVELVAQGVARGCERTSPVQQQLVADEPAAWSVEQVARVLGCSEPTILRALDAGQLPELPRWSKRRLIPRRAVELIVEQSMAGFDPAAAVEHLRAAS